MEHGWYIMLGKGLLNVISNLFFVTSINQFRLLRSTSGHKPLQIYDSDIALLSETLWNLGNKFITFSILNVSLCLWITIQVYNWWFSCYKLKGCLWHSCVVFITNLDISVTIYIIVLSGPSNCRVLILPVLTKYHMSNIKTGSITLWHNLVLLIFFYFIFTLFNKVIKYNILKQTKNRKTTSLLNVIECIYLQQIKNFNFIKVTTTLCWELFAWLICNQSM